MRQITTMPKRSVQEPSRKNVSMKAPKPATTATDQPLTATTSGTKRKRTVPTRSKVDPTVLPHGLGKLFSGPANTDKVKTSEEGPEAHKAKVESPEKPADAEERFNFEDPLPDGIRVEDTWLDGTQIKDLLPKLIYVEDLLPDAPKVKRKRNRRAGIDYNHQFGKTPFPHFNRPTPEECHIVNDLLTLHHGEKKAPAVIPPPSKTFAGCGETQATLDAIIRTRLSANVTGDGSGLAIQGLYDTFGITVDGNGRESVDWDLVRRSPLDKVVSAIQRAGHQNVKGQNIKYILNMVYVENNIRRKSFVDPDFAKQMSLDNESVVQQSAKLSCADPKILSLDHLRGLSYHQAFRALLPYPGIALKTASCVSLYNFQQPSFAVDTHVQRITGWLGWRPEKAKENQTFSHLEYMIPDELKYSLHTLFVQHGKECVRCQSKTHAESPGWENGCIIDHLVKRIKNHETKQRKAKMGDKDNGSGESGGDEDGEDNLPDGVAAKTVRSGRVVKKNADPRAKRVVKSKAKATKRANTLDFPLTKVGKAGDESKRSAKEVSDESEEEKEGSSNEEDDTDGSDSEFREEEG